MVQKIDLAKIGYDPKYYPRVNGDPDWMTVLRYTEALQVDPKMDFPPVVVVRAMVGKCPFMLIDGLHRDRSYIKAGRTTIPATIERIPQSKWMARSVELNCTNGRPLDARDKAWVATRLGAEGWEIKDVAQLLKMKVESLERIVSARCVKIDSKTAELVKIGGSNRKVNGGHVGFLKAPLTGATGKGAMLEALKSQQAVTSHDVLAVLDSMISVLRAGVVNMADEDVTARVQTIRKLLKGL